MNRKFSVIRFEKKYGNKGGLAKLVFMRINGSTLQEIGDYFGLTEARIQQICDYLVQNSKMPSKEVIEAEMLEKKVAEATQNKV
jgi:hypothetical protein